MTKPFNLPTDRAVGGPAPANDINAVNGHINDADTEAVGDVLVVRDAAGRARFSDPSHDSDAATKGYAHSLQNMTSLKEYGAVGDGVTDDSEAIATALLGKQGSSIFVPTGVFIVNSATRLLLEGNFTTLVGDPSGHSEIRFTHINGGLDIGNGTDNVYESRIRDILISGNNTATKVVRMRKVYEPYFFNSRIEQSSPGAGSMLLELDDCGQLDADRLVLATSPTGIKLVGATPPVINVRLGNFFALGSAVRLSSPGVARLCVRDSWVEACSVFLDFDRDGGAISLGEVILKDVRFFHAGTFRLMKATAFTSLNSQRLEVNGVYIDAQASTVAMCDFSAIDNSAATLRIKFVESTVLMGGTEPLIKPHASQSWWLFITNVQDINGLTTDRWSVAPLAMGGCWPKPYVLSGVGVPEAAVTAPQGSVYHRQDGWTDLTLYSKEMGHGNTGWVAK